MRKLQTLSCQMTILLLPLHSFPTLPYVEPFIHSGLFVIKV